MQCRAAFLQYLDVAAAHSRTRRKPTPAPVHVPNQSVASSPETHSGVFSFSSRLKNRWPASEFPVPLPTLIDLIGLLGYACVCDMNIMWNVHCPQQQFCGASVPCVKKLNHENHSWDTQLIGWLLFNRGKRFVGCLLSVLTGLLRVL